MSQCASLFYWHREAKSSSAEVDCIAQFESTIVPIEVKAGVKGRMQSMHRFLADKRVGTGVRSSLENFASYGPIRGVPLYALGQLWRLLPA